MSSRRIFISYKFSGLPEPKIRSLLDPIYQALQTLDGYQVYCNCTWWIMYTPNMNTNKLMRKCLAQIQTGDIFLLVLNDYGLGHNNIWHGSLIELGHALAKGCTVLAHVQKGAMYDDTGKLHTALSLCAQINDFKEIGDIAKLLDMVKIY